MKLSLVMLGVLLVGCGDDGGGNTLPDAPRSDALLGDAPPDSPTAGIAKITVLDGLPVEGATVYFLNADGSSAATVQTDAAGKAEATITPGGSVTVVNPFNQVFGGPASPELKTVMGVQPGDDLKMINARPRSSFFMTFMLPFNGNALFYAVSTTCGGEGSAGGGSNTSRQILMDDCGTADVLGEIAPTQRWIYKPNVTVAAGAAVDLTAETYADFVTRTVTLTNSRVALANAGFFRTLVTPRGKLFRASAQIAVGTAAVATVQLPAPAGVTVVDELEAYESATAHELYNASTNTDQTIDLTSALLKNFGSEGSVDGATGSVTWQQGATGADADFATVKVDAYMGKSPRVFSWTIYAPGAGNAIKFPVLPGAGAAYVLSDDLDYGVYDLKQVKVTGGYDAVRESVFATEDVADLVSTGRVVIARPVGVSLRARATP